MPAFNLELLFHLNLIWKSSGDAEIDPDGFQIERIPVWTPAYGLVDNNVYSEKYTEQVKSTNIACLKKALLYSCFEK